MRLLNCGLNYLKVNNMYPIFLNVGLNHKGEDCEYNIQWSDEDEGFIATAPEYPGLSAFGSTPGEAAKELFIAMDAWLEVLEEDGEVK